MPVWQNGNEMNISDFTYILQNPKQINASQTDTIASVVKEFPYFQAARVVHLKGLKNQDSYKYNQSLKVTAAHTADRSILFEFITSKIFHQHSISETIKESHNNTSDIEVETEEIVLDASAQMEQAIKTKIQEADAILDPELFQPKVTVPIAAIVPETEAVNEAEIIEETPTTEPTPSNETTPEETLQLGKPLSFNQQEKHSFSEWLRLTNFKPIERQEEKTQKEEIKEEEKIISKETVASDKTKRFDLIDKFIDANPKIVPKATKEKTINLAKENSIDQSILMTETLAKVYLEQKKYKKAIKAYDILILKYPEKSGFFADQIRAIKKLQQNN